MDEQPVAPFFSDLAARAGTAPLSEAEADAVLDLTRVVAHTRERRLAPLTAYAAALAMGELDEDTRIARLRELIAMLAAEA